MGRGLRGAHDLHYTPLMCAQEGPQRRSRRRCSRELGFASCAHVLSVLRRFARRATTKREFGPSHGQAPKQRVSVMEQLCYAAKRHSSRRKSRHSVCGWDLGSSKVRTDGDDWPDGKARRCVAEWPRPARFRRAPRVSARPEASPIHPASDQLRIASTIARRSDEYPEIQHEDLPDISVSLGGGNVDGSTGDQPGLETCHTGAHAGPDGAVHRRGAAGRDAI